MSAWHLSGYMFCIVFHTQSGNVRPTNCSCGSAHMNALSWDLHALRQCHAKGLLLCDCPDACFVLCLACIEVISEVLLRDRPRCMFCIALCKHWGNTRLTNCLFAGSPRCVFRIVFYTHLGNMRLTNCLCGIAQMHVWYCVVHTLKQYQADGWLLWELPGVCFVICFASFEAMSGQWNTTSNNWQSIKRCTRYDKIRLTSCFCGIVRTHVRYRVLHALGQYQADVLFPQACRSFRFITSGQPAPA